MAQKQLKSDLKLIFQRLERRQQPKYQYALLGWYIFEHFEAIFLPLFSNDEHKQVIQRAFQSYKNKTL